MHWRQWHLCVPDNLTSPEIIVRRGPHKVEPLTPFEMADTLIRESSSDVLIGASRMSEAKTETHTLGGFSSYLTKAKAKEESPLKKAKERPTSQRHARVSFVLLIRVLLS